MKASQIAIIYTNKLQPSYTAEFVHVSEVVCPDRLGNTNGTGKYFFEAKQISLNIIKQCLGLELLFLIRIPFEKSSGY